MTLVLSHDPRTRLACGYFGYTLDEGDNILATMKRSAHLALHPLFLPALIHSTWFKIMFDQYGQIHREIRTVQEKTGVMKRYLIAGGQSKMNKFDKITQSNHDDIHETIVEQHAYLSTALSDFVGQLGPSLTAGLELAKNMNIAVYQDLGLEAFVAHLTSRTERELEHRQQLLKRIDVQIQVVSRDEPSVLDKSGDCTDLLKLYTLMQQRDSHYNLDIAEETKKDSSAMKSLALITMIFLPTTALAVCRTFSVKYLSHYLPADSFQL
jgi:hypothetical protein